MIRRRSCSLSATFFGAFMGYFSSNKFLLSAHLRLILIYIGPVWWSSLFLSCFLWMKLKNLLFSRIKEHCINKFAFLIFIMFRSRVSSVGIATGYGMDGWDWIPGRGKRFFSTLHRVQTSSGAHPASYLMSNVGSFHGGEAAGA
jgi:hypothetical protein